MIALDTNVLVCLLVEDDEAHMERAKSLIEKIQADEETAWVADIVMCELVWVLSRSYDVSRDEISGLVDALLRASHLEFDDSATLRRALDSYRDGKGDFADYVIHERAREAGFSQVATFDRALLTEPGFFQP